MIENLLNDIVNADSLQVRALLQNVNSLIIKQYHLRIGNLQIYPIEVESYYYHSKQFPDPYVHNNELQSNRLGKLYFHRYGIQAQHEIKKENRAGMDICLSDSENYYYGILIRMAKVVNNGASYVITGPALLQNYIVNHLNHHNSEINWPAIIDYEANALVLENNNEPLNCTIYHLPRIGLKEQNAPLYYDLPLRSITDFRLSKNQSDDVAWYMLDKIIEPTMENIIGLLGRRSNVVLQKIKTKKG